MKLRILGDSLRLRLSQSEVRRFDEEGRVEQSIRFAPGESKMTYVLEHDASATSLEARFEAGTITVRMPTDMARAWSSTDQVSLQARQAISGDDGEALSLLVEKDFKCVVPRPGEEEYDGFPHPTGAC